MKVKALAITAGVLGLAGAANADMTGASLENMGDIGGGANTWRVYLDFDSPTDTLLAVSGNADVSALFYNGAALINDSLFAGSSQEDVFQPFPISEAWDSWVSIGDTASHNTAFSPGFGGGVPGVSVIQGTSWGQPDNGGYFDQDPGTAEQGGHILIAQFTVAGDFEYGGTGDWVTGGAGQTSTAFYVNTVPAPGALALLGLAGLAGRRRRG